MRIVWRGSGIAERSAPGLPERGKPAAFAKAHDAFTSGANVGFDSSVVDSLHGVAGSAGQRNHSQLAFEIADGRKLDPPEIHFCVDERDAVGVVAVAGAKLADDANFRFLVELGIAQDELLLGRKFVLGKDAGAVEAEENGFGALGKDFSVQIVTDQEDGNFLRDAAAAAHNLLWQAADQKRLTGGPIQY